jgi:peptide/nickel transport system permease protein
MAQDNPAHLEEAFKLMAAGDKLRARVSVIKTLEANPDLELAWVILSYLVDDPDQQRYALNQALRINPENRKARDLLSELGDGHREDRLQSIESEISRKPFADKAGDIQEDKRLGEAQTCFEAGDLASARFLLEQTLKNNPKNAQAWYLFSFVMRTQKGQVAALGQALERDPHHKAAKSRVAELQVVSVPQEPAALPTLKEGKFDWQMLSRLARYVFKRGIVLFLTVVVGVYVTILVANMGGYVDELIRGIIGEQLLAIGMSEAYDEVPVDEREAYMEQMEWQLEEAMGLHEPFLLRSVRWLVHGLTLNLGPSRLTYWFGYVLTGPDQNAQKLVLSRLPYTLVLIGSANVLFLFSSISVALVLSRKYGGWMDRVSAALASLGSAPSWVFGIVLILVLAGGLRILPFPKAIDLKYADITSPRFIKLLLVQMIMPVLAIFLSVFFQGIYTWRTFFLIYSQENYVELGRAKGLPWRMLEHRYILRPTLPYVITNFAMMMIALWETVLALEILFYWPGIGSLFVRAVQSYTQTSLVIAIVVVFAYLLVITLFVLDIIYAVIDPRVAVNGDNQVIKSVGARPRLSLQNGLHLLMTGPRDFFQGMLDWIRAVPNWFKATRTSRIGLRSLRLSFQEISKFPSAIVGLGIILILIGISIYTVFAIPYDQAIELWRAHGSEDGRNIWARSPRNAEPVWFNYFRMNKRPETLILDSHDPSVTKEYKEKGEGMEEITISFPFEYDYGDFPDELNLFFESHYDQKIPHVSVYWLTPDGREIRLTSFSAEESHEYRLALDEKLSRKFSGLDPMVGLFADPQVEKPTPLKGDYELQVQAITFEEDSDLDSELVLYGKVHGLAGTDHQRRDLMIALLWGTPVALAFGLLGAIGTSLIAMLIAALGVWRGGGVDAAIQRITEINMILPILPIAIMIYFLYSRSIWVILGVIILLNIFGSSIKNYRAAFLQVKESAYVEGAIAYGASNSRIILHYMLPRIMPVLLPQLVILVPGFIFYEATLAYLGLSDPYLPTWGKVVYDAFTNGAYQGYYYWIILPIALLMITGLAFALLGFSLDRVVNPRLRDI